MRRIKFSGILRYKLIYKSPAGGKNLSYSGFCRPSESQSENQIKGKERQVFRPSQRTKKAVKHENDCDTNSNWCARNEP